MSVIQRKCTICVQRKCMRRRNRQATVYVKGPLIAPRISEAGRDPGFQAWRERIEGAHADVVGGASLKGVFDSLNARLSNHRDQLELASLPVVAKPVS